MEKDIFQNVMLAGLGLAEKTKEKTHEIIEKLVQQGKLSKEQGQHIIKEVRDATVKGTEEAVDKVQHGFKDAKERLSFATNSDLEKLDARLSALEKKIKALEVTVLGLGVGESVSTKKRSKKKT